MTDKAPKPTALPGKIEYREPSQEGKLESTKGFQHIRDRIQQAQKMTSKESRPVAQ